MCKLQINLEYGAEREHVPVTLLIPRDCICNRVKVVLKADFQDVGLPGWNLLQAAS
jgi:hypothetical protein